MSINFNETFIDENSSVYNYYIGIPNLEIKNIFELENIIKRYKKQSLDFLSINIFNLSIHSFIGDNTSKDSVEVINKFIMNISKKYKMPIIFSYSISANPIAYFDCWNSRFIYKGDIQSIKQLSEYLINDKSSFLTVKKPHRGILSLIKTQILLLKLCSIEVCSLNNDCSIADFENIYYSLLDNGWMVGAISSYNSLNLNCWYTGIISRHCYSDMLIDSIKNKLTYSTRIHDLKLYYSINFIPMGKALEINKLPFVLSFYISVQTSQKIIESIEIVSNGKELIKSCSLIPANKIHFIFKYSLIKKSSWFVVRILGKEEVLAISSPVFIKYKKALADS